MNLEINIENKHEAKEQLILVQKSFDDLLEVMNLQKKQLNTNAKQLEESAQLIQDLTNSAVGFSDALKDIHILLGSKKDLWKNDVEINGLMSGLAVMVSGAAMVKLGVVSNAKN